jgi:hypothetical protein
MATPLAILVKETGHGCGSLDPWLCPFCARFSFVPFRYFEVRVCSECARGTIWPWCFWCCGDTVPVVCEGTTSHARWYSVEWADRVDVSADAVAVSQSEMFERLLRFEGRILYTGCSECGRVEEADWLTLLP